MIDIDIFIILLLFVTLRSSRTVSISKRATSPSSDDSTTDDGESSSEDEQFTDLKTLSAQGDLPNEFWQVLFIIYFEHIDKY